MIDDDDLKSLVATALGNLQRPEQNVADIRSLTRALWRAGHDTLAHRLTWFESQTDEYPVGKVRGHWNVEVLKRRDAEVASFCAEVEHTLREDLLGIAAELAGG